MIKHLLIGCLFIFVSVSQAESTREESLTVFSITFSRFSLSIRRNHLPLLLLLLLVSNFSPAIVDLGTSISCPESERSARRKEEIEGAQSAEDAAGAPSTH